MARKKSSESEKLAQALIDLAPETQVEAVIESLESFCSQLEARGISSNILDAALFTAWGLRYAERNDRSGYEEILETALDDAWEEITVH